MATEFPQPPFQLWQQVGHENEVWRIAGFHYRPGYNTHGWEFLLCQPMNPGSMIEYVSENCKTKTVRDDQVITIEALLQDRVDKSGKYAAETRRIADAAEAEHQRLMAEGMPQ